MGKLSALLAEFQAGHPVAKFDREGQSGGSRKYGYASYNAVIECLKPLAAKGLCWHHAVGGRRHDGDVYELTVTTTLAMGDETVSTTISHPLPPNIQTLGSYITYLKRYQLVALCGIAADEDDDGASAKDEQTSKTSRAAKPAPASKPTASEAVSATDTKPTLDKALAEIVKCPTSIKRQELLALVNTRIKQGKLTQGDYLVFAKKMISYITDGDEVSTNIGSLFLDAYESKSIDDMAMRELTGAIELRMRQIESMAKVGGTLKQGV